MIKKFFAGMTLFFCLLPSTFAKQFSECSAENNQFLDQQLSYVRALYPEAQQKEITAPVGPFQGIMHDYGPLSIDGRFIFKGDERVQGIMVNYFFHKREQSLAQFAEDIKVMKAQGIIGVSLEVPWYEYEPQDNHFTPPVYIEKALDIVEANGLYTTLLLSPHYTPDWFFEKMGNVYMERPDHTPIIWDNLRTLVPEAGAYMTYSPFAQPAIAEQIAFDVAATQHYEQRPSVVAIFLSNEQTYPKEIKVDYSSHAQAAWQAYLQARGHPSKAMPTTPQDPDYRLFEYFLQDGLHAMHQQIITAVQAKQSTTVPVTDRLILYESISDNAFKYHQRPLRGNDHSTIVANDIYGYTPNVLALQYGYQKPIIVAETNLLGSCDAAAMQDYMMLHFLSGSSIVSLFKWDRGDNPYSLLGTDGSIKERARGVFEAAKKIQSLQQLSYPMIEKSFTLNRDAILDAGYRGERVDSDSVVEQAWQVGVVPMIYWEDDNVSIHSSQFLANHKQTLLLGLALVTFLLGITFVAYAAIKSEHT